jgi:hypothetical protein
VNHRSAGPAVLLGNRDPGQAVLAKDRKVFKRRLVCSIPVGRPRSESIVGQSPDALAQSFDFVMVDRGQGWLLQSLKAL